MTQVTNYNVANGPRATVRQAFNAVLAALRDDNSGPTAPPNPVPGMVWRDTSTSPAVLRVRDDTNTEWLTAFEAWFSGDAVGARDSLGLGSGSLANIGEEEGDLVTLIAGDVFDPKYIPRVVGARVIRTVGIPSAVAAVDFTSTDMDLTEYSDFCVVYRNLIPTVASKLITRTSSDGGVTFASGAGSYAFSLVGATSASGIGANGSPSITQVEIGLAATHATIGGGASGRLWLYACDRPLRQKMDFDMSHWRSDNAFEKNTGGGMRLADATINGLRIMFGSGNIAANANSSITLYGVPK